VDSRGGDLLVVTPYVKRLAIANGDDADPVSRAAADEADKHELLR
jgi:hypothetical protein